SCSASDADVLVLPLQPPSELLLPALLVAARVLRLERQRFTLPGRRIALDDRMAHPLPFDQLRILGAGAERAQRDERGGQCSNACLVHGSAPPLALLRAARTVGGAPTPELGALAACHHALPVDVRQLLAVAAEQRLR